MSLFKERTIDIVRGVPLGRVASYGQIALYLGIPRAARQVGWILNGISEKDILTPWWRVINNRGLITIKGSRYTANEQKQLLLAEGVEVDNDFALDIEKYRFVPDERFLDRLKLDSLYLEMISRKIPYMKQYFGSLVEPELKKRS